MTETKHRSRWYPIGRRGGEYHDEERPVRRRGSGRAGPRRSSDRQWQGLASKLAERSRNDPYQRLTSDDEEVIYDAGPIAREPRYERHRARGIQGDDYDEVSNAAAAWHRTAEWLNAKARESEHRR